jgi:membrane carboxypeptidase/penicillin-binding protein
MSPNKTYNAPACIDIRDKSVSKPWHVCNAEPASFGTPTITEATWASINTVFAQIIRDEGPDHWVKTALEMGLRCCTRFTNPNTKLLPVLSATLGSNPVNTVEMASAYGTLATGGLHVQPTPVTRITDAEGKTVTTRSEEARAGLNRIVWDLKDGALRIALEVADAVGMPLMAHIDHPPPSYEEVIEMLRPGDILTHAFRPFPNSPATHQGTVKKEVLDARKRGVQFDIGHGKGSFAFKTARAMLANGFLPDTISSDVHQLCINGPAYDQVTTMSKFLCMGMPLGDVIAASTVNSAMALKRPELGSLKPGSVGDATILSIKEGRFDYVDVVGEHLTGDKRILSEGVVLKGRWWHPNDATKFKKLEKAA